MIELLGIGVAERGVWRLRRLCLRLEERTLVAVLSERRDQRLALLEVIGGRVVPSEGRAWINGTPLTPETAARIRRRVHVIDLARPHAMRRPAPWHVVHDRVGLAVRPRAKPEYLIVAEPDAQLPRNEAATFLRFLRDLAACNGLPIVASLGDPSLACEADTVLTIAGGAVVARAPGRTPPHILASHSPQSIA